MDVNGTLLNNGLYTNLNPFSPSFVLARLFLPVGSSYPSSLFLSSFLFFLFLRLRYSLPRHKCGLITLGRPFPMRPVNHCSILERLSGLAFHDVA